MAEPPSSDGVLRGVSAAPGVGVGPAMLLRGRGRRSAQRHIDGSEVAAELQRLKVAVSAVIGELKRTEQHLRDAAPSEHTSIAMALIGSHRAVLTDPLLVGGVQRHIRDRLRNAEWALECVVDELRNTMFKLENSGLRDWWRDVEALVDTLLTTLAGGAQRRGFGTEASVIAVAPTIGIADIIELAAAGGAGVVLEEGSLTSHVAVLCRAAGIPAVVGVHDACSRLENGRQLVVDGTLGTVHHDDAATNTGVDSGLSCEKEVALTACGQAIVVRANLSLQLSAATARRMGTRGVGLMRTFYQYVGRTTLPTEDELAEVYTRVARDFHPDPVTIRLLDLGGSFGPEELPAELRNLRDCRGIRLFTERSGVIVSQIRALCRAATVGNLRVLVPFVTDLEEVRSVREAFDEQAADLGDTGALPTAIGAMIEVPAAVLQIDALAELTDFFAIGTNDLSQYILATPRDSQVRPANHIHPAVLRAIALVCAAGERHNKGVSLCGEIASEPGAIAALLGAGLRELSVSPRLAPAVIAAIGSTQLTT